MNINTKQIAEVKIIQLDGEIDTSTASTVQKKVLSLIQPDCKLLLDLSQVNYMSSAGLRLLLSLYRQTIAKQGKLVLVGLSEDIEDTMSVTGFLNFFTTCKTVNSGLEALN
ncbi:STAS domain-containing protein [Pleurocapsa sp. PCC 7319]|uniref:STAS domain-containing protein n=1 Tax=Pleurocapsa sp. PCC 7319 TaxID=118161 RepID=UPI00034DEA4E|nr:STAS domain-containing protein [Pleurocapsa sp. PCC 7319]